MRKILKILLCVSFILMIGCNDGGGGGDDGCDGDIEARAVDWKIGGAGIFMIADFDPLLEEDLQDLGGSLIWEETEVILCAAAHPLEAGGAGISIREIGDGFLRIGDGFALNKQNTEDCSVDDQLQEAFDDYGLPITACLWVKACGDKHEFCAPLEWI